jgi:hypothetical protein
MADKEAPHDKLQEKMCEKFEQIFQKHFHNSPEFSANLHIVNKIQEFKAEYLATLREK